MLKFALFGIPIAIEGWFWLTTALLGGAIRANRDPEAWAEVAVWIAVVFVSILVHEFGHAFAGRKYGASPYIRLHGFGGVTFLPGAGFTRGQNMFVSAAGPLAGFALALLVWLVRESSFDLPPMADLAIRQALKVNVVWTLLNLLPIQPLDGGQILGQALGPRRINLTSSIGFTLATILCVWAFFEGWIFSAIMLGMLAYYNFRRQPVEGGVVTQ